MEPSEKRQKIQAGEDKSESSHTHGHTTDNDAGDMKDNADVSVRKKKVALLISYCGSGYYGMQKNPDVNTIESELLNALWKAGAIKEDVKDDLTKLSFQRCARTDKGVSAVRQVVSLKMVPEERMIPLTNRHLPPEIRVMGMNRVTRGFDCKLSCAARTYEYLLPSFAFAPTFYETRKDYHIKDTAMSLVRQVLESYKGTHNFHNFTSGRLHNDASATRYIMDFTASEAFVRSGQEFLCLSVTGQSFMLHQIRKMIGLCIAICKGHCTADKVTEAWEQEKLDIPRAPGLGLVLDKVHYTGYNKRYGSDGIHQPITWKDQEPAVTAFKEEFIWKTIIDSEVTERPMMRWLTTLKCHTYTNERTSIPGRHQDIETSQPQSCDNQHQLDHAAPSVDTGRLTAVGPII